MKFILFYKGPVTPPSASHKGWPAWFAEVGSAVVDVGAPLSNGIIARSDGSTTDSTTRFNGYSIIEAKNIDKVLELIKDHPYLALGDEYTIEIFKRG